ncbi:TetR/AcrR family transcriptional regulator C-terminal domain-containing protein [Actinoplanes sp. NPDC051513]|uniref:TetR/AcrR family transcriptional regulator C-terminal domain-containing protein n=1 Tax=Actinoplanes sp. NPDC051513 TaxID=3363908 RepID=UPI0037B145B0
MTGTPPQGPARVRSRPRPEGRRRLTREVIVAAGLRLADAEGLDAVSIRGLAAMLGARPMSLYRHIERKEDLLDLMFDDLAGAVLEDGPLPSGWRDALMVVADRKRRVCLAHPWAAALYARRPRIGPNSVMQLELAIAALRPLTADLVQAVRVVNAVDDYTIGHVTRELIYDAGGEADWSQAMRPYLTGLADSGRYPTLAPLLADPVRDDSDATFAAGLGWLLDGIAKSFGRDG